MEHVQASLMGRMDGAVTVQQVRLTNACDWCPRVDVANDHWIWYAV